MHSQAMRWCGVSSLRMPGLCFCAQFLTFWRVFIAQEDAILQKQEELMERERSIFKTTVSSDRMSLSDVRKSTQACMYLCRNASEVHLWGYGQGASWCVGDAKFLT